MRFYDRSEIDRGNRAFFISTWPFNSSIASINELSSAIKAHISSEVAAGHSRLQTVENSSSDPIKMFLRRGTSARDQTISNDIVVKSFEAAQSKKSGWLTIFCLNMAGYMKKVDGGLSAVAKEVTSLEQLNTMNVSDLTNIGLRGGALQMMTQIAQSLRQSSSVTPSPSPSPSPLKNRIDSMENSSQITPTRQSPTKDDINLILEQFFVATSRYYQTSEQPRLASEEAYFKLRKGIVVLVEEFFQFHESSRQKRNRDNSSSDDSS